MTTRVYQQAKRNVRRSRRAARDPQSLAGPLHGVAPATNTYLALYA